MNTPIPLIWYPRWHPLYPDPIRMFLWICCQSTDEARDKIEEVYMANEHTRHCRIGSVVFKKHVRRF